MALVKDLIGSMLTPVAKERYRDWLLRMAVYLPRPLMRGFLRLSRRLHVASTVRTPDTLFFFITNICNQSCIHCFYAAELNRPKQAISLEHIKTLCHSLHGRTPTVFLCGGEPTTRQDLPAIATAFIETAKVKSLFITTNGLLQKRLLETVEAALASRRQFQLRIAISLDGPEPIHDRIRKYPGGFQQAIETLCRLLERSQQDSRLTPLITSVIQRDNAEVFPAFYRQLRETYACEVQFILIRQDNRDVGGLDKTILLDAGNAENLLPDPAVCRRIIQEIETYERARPNPSSVPLFRASILEHHLRIVEHPKSVAPCVAPNSFATIFPDGATSLCELVHPYANLRDFHYDLAACWNSPAANHQRQQLSACWCTYPCALLNSVVRDPHALSTSLDYVKARLSPVSGAGHSRQESPN